MGTLVVHNITFGVNLVAILSSGWSHHSESIVSRIRVWSVLKVVLALILGQVLTTAPSTESTEVVSAPIEPSGGDRGLSLLS